MTSPVRPTARPLSPLAHLHPLELQAMRLDGELVSDAPALGVGVGVDAERDYTRWFAPDEPLDRVERMRVIARHVPAGFIVCGSTAAWVYDGVRTCEHLELLTRTRRATAPIRPAVRLRYQRVLPSDTVTLLRRSITTPARTLIDLALDGAATERLDVLVRSLSGAERTTLPDEVRISVRGRMGATVARDRLAAVLDLPARSLPA